MLADLKNQLLFGNAQARHDPFGLGLSYANGNGDLVPHALGYALEAGLYDVKTGKRVPITSRGMPGGSDYVYFES